MGVLRCVNGRINTNVTKNVTKNDKLHTID